METLQEILHNSKTINIHELEKDFNNCMLGKFGVSNASDNENPYLILIIENDRIIQIGFTKKIATYVLHEMSRKFETSTYKATKLEIQMYIKDMTNEGIDYNNFRTYKNLYIKEFMQSKKIY